MQIKANLVNNSTNESGLILFDDGTIAIWGCDEPLWVITPTGELTQEWQADRFPCKRTPYGLHLDDLDEDDEPFTGNTNEAQNVLIRKVLYNR